MSSLQDVKDWCRKNPLMALAIVAGVMYVLCNQGYLQDPLNSVLSLFGLDGFDVQGTLSKAPDMAAPLAAEEGAQEGQKAVTGMRTPATCYPQETLKPQDLLPEEEGKAIQEFNSSAPVAEGILNVSMLQAGEHIGVDTVGQSLRNANRQLRSEPPNPQVNVSPWQNTTIGPDLMRRPLEVSESCSGQQ